MAPIVLSKSLLPLQRYAHSFLNTYNTPISFYNCYTMARINGQFFRSCEIMYKVKTRSCLNCRLLFERVCVGRKRWHLGAYQQSYVLHFHRIALDGKKEPTARDRRRGQSRQSSYAA